MATGSERYRKHKVWETLTLKRDALAAARYDDARAEQWRKDIVEWLTEAAKTKAALQPALYLSALNNLSIVLNELPSADAAFKQFVGVNNTGYGQPRIDNLEAALRALPLPPPRDLKDSYVKLLDDEIEARTARLDQLEARVEETETALRERLQQTEQLSKSLDALESKIATSREEIATVSSEAQTKIDTEWAETLDEWKRARDEADAMTDAQALVHVTTLAATAKAGEALAEHAAGSLSATDWTARGKRERRAAQVIRAGAWGAFLVAAAVGWYIVNEAIRDKFDLTVGDGILRASVALVIGAFGALLLRESGRHFREADTAEDVALSLRALAPFYAGSTEDVRIDARKQVGDAVLVRNVLSRFAHRDAAKHAGGVDVAELPHLVEEATNALKNAREATGS